MDEISNLFNYFVQEDSSNTRGYEGSGLGLAIVKGLVTLLNGNIKVFSEKTMGTTFYVSIPFDNECNKGKDTDNKNILSIKSNDPLILIAEDDDDNYFLLETIFKKYSFKFLRAANGIEAIDLFKKHSDISLILIDLKMPVMNGFEATKQIKAINKDIPVIAVTAFALADDENIALQAGCDDYLAKPIKKDLLIKKLEKFGIIANLNL